MSARRMTNRWRSPRRVRRGLSLSELLISLAITASLLTAVAAAFSASAQAVETNDEFFRATQAGRVSLVRMLSDARRGTVDDKSTATALRLIVGSEDRTYQFIAAEKRLVMITNDGIDDPPLTLARNVTDVQFATDVQTDANGTPYVARALVNIAVQVGANEIRLSGSASPRKYLTY